MHKGKKTASYGENQLKHLANKLQAEFGNGFNERNLRRMRAFYQIKNPKAREWYLQDSIEHNWSVRALKRQIDKLYYERLLSSKNKQPVIDEANNHIEPLKNNPKD